MTEPMIWRAQARLEVANPGGLLDALCAHFLEHDLLPDVHQGQRRRYSLGTGSIELDVQDGAIVADALAATLDDLENIRMSVGSHLLEYADDPQARLRWSGDGGGKLQPPAFRAMRVMAVSDMSPHLRRVMLAGEDLARFAVPDNFHCKLYFPQPGVSEPQWPSLSEDGVPVMPQGEYRLDMRTYTLRQVHPEEGTLEIDFVMHSDAGPGSAWAARARPGDWVGMSGPGGQAPRAAQHYLLAGDETALPAMARALENLPDTATGVALIEVQDRQDQLPLVAPKGVKVQWLLRGQAEPGTTTLLIDALRAQPWPQPGVATYVWAGAEFEAFRAIRRYVREERGMQTGEHLVVAYWRRGLSETQMKGKPKAA